MNWRAHILDSFTPDVARKTVVLDTDGLFREEHLFRELAERGFRVVHFEDPIAFRFTYESEFRRDWDGGGSLAMVVVLGPGADEFEELPADVLDHARQLSFHLQDIFPNLSYNVLSRLDLDYFDLLFPAHQRYARQPLGDAMTKDFILRHVFEIAPEVIKRDSDLLRTLLQRHYRRLNVPSLLDEYFVSVLASSRRFADWPLDIIVHDREAFWEFLQERWPLFVGAHGSAPGEDSHAAELAAAMRFRGPLALPFDHDDVRVYIDNLFVEGILKPIAWAGNVLQTLPWARIGIAGTSEGRSAACLADLLKGIEESRPGADASVQDWLAFAPKYARVKALRTADPHGMAEMERARCDALAAELNQGFESWVRKRYAGLYNYPPVSPVMVHHIPGFLAHRLDAQAGRRIAFLLVDGLSLDQWHILRDAVAPKLPGLTCDERALLAWVPTTTPVSRQAAFSGKIPGYFAGTIQRTDKDEEAWRRFWSDRGLAPDQVGFIAIPGDAADMARIDGALSHETRVVGVTIFKVDKIMHGIQLGAVGMANQVRTWGTEPFLQQLLGDLLARGFEIWLSADHGNTEAVGIGTPKEGVLTDTRGERCRVYSSPALRAKFAGNCPGALCWEHPALPGDYCCLLAPPGRAFAQAGQVVMCHGGISIDEVVVPFVRIGSRKDIF